MESYNVQLNQTEQKKVEINEQRTNTANDNNYIFGKNPSNFNNCHFKCEWFKQMN